MKHIYLSILALLLCASSKAQTPAPITPAPDTICIGASITLTDATPGGVWTTSTASITIGMTSGVVTGLSAGIATVTYALGGGGFVTAIVTVLPPPPGISGSSTVNFGFASIDG